MNSSASLFIKILSLALVTWAVIATSVLSAQNAGWVPWLALLLLLLLDAYATDSRPASWGQWSAGLQRLLGPGMLPYYAVLAAFLVFGPSQVWHITPPGAPIFSGPPNKFDRPGQGNLPNQHLGANAVPGRQTGFPANNGAPRSTTLNPGATVQPASNAPGSPPNSVPLKGAPVNSIQPQPAVFQRVTGAQAVPPANGAAAPSATPSANNKGAPPATPTTTGTAAPGVTPPANGMTAPRVTPPVNGDSAPVPSANPATK